MIFSPGPDRDAETPATGPSAEHSPAIRPLANFLTSACFV
jgi:hypothetical protein